MTSKTYTHYITGSGSHGCLYDNGPHAHPTLKSAVEDLAFVFELGERRKRRLRADRYLVLGGDFGADYCEITECHCLTPWEHNEDGNNRPEDWPDYPQPTDEEDGGTIDHYDGLTGRLVLVMPRETVAECFHLGECGLDVKAWLDRVYFVATLDEMRAILRESGGWEAEEIAEMSEEDIKGCVLWMACGDAREEARTRANGGE